MRLLPAFTFFLFLFSGCARNNEQQIVRYNDNGRAKPIVSFVPVMHQKEFVFPWDLTEEFTTDISEQFLKRKRLFLKLQSSKNEIYTNYVKNQGFDKNSDPKPAQSKIDSSNSLCIQPFKGDISWIKRAFLESEYAVFMELIDHHISPVNYSVEPSPQEKTAKTLEMTMRIRVIDLRQAQPKIILQEIIKQTHTIPKFLSEIDYSKCRWGMKRYRISPIGLAHRQLIKEVVSRVEDYILLSQSK